MGGRGAHPPPEAGHQRPTSAARPGAKSMDWITLQTRPNAARSTKHEARSTKIPSLASDPAQAYGSAIMRNASPFIGDTTAESIAAAARSDLARPDLARSDLARSGPARGALTGSGLAASGLNGRKPNRAPAHRSPADRDVARPGAQGNRSRDQDPHRRCPQGLAVRFAGFRMPLARAFGPRFPPPSARPGRLCPGRPRLKPLPGGCASRSRRPSRSRA